MLHVSVYYFLFYLSIYIRRLFPLPGTPPRGWPRQKSRHFSLFLHSSLAFSNPLILPSPLSFTYSITLSSHFTGGLPLTPTASTSLLYTLLVISFSFILSMWPNHLRVLRLTHSTAPHFIPSPLLVSDLNIHT